MRFAFALVALLVALTGCTTPTSSHPGEATFRVMTYNIHHGEGLDGKVDLARIAALIKQEDADIVALQEVDKGVARTARRDCPAELAALTGMTCVFSNNFHYQGGEYGNAVLTKFQVKHWTNHHYQMLRPNEQRGILQLTLEVHGRELVFLNTHIDYRSDDSERWKNLSEIEELARQYQDAPIIMCGDFNSTPDSRIHQRLAKTFIDSWQQIGPGEGWTIPVKTPRRRIDYIWHSEVGNIEPVRIWIPHSEASDHLPVVAELKFP